MYGEFGAYVNKSKSENNQKVLGKLREIFAVNVLNQDSGLLELGYITKADRKYFREQIAKLNGEVRYELIGIIDALAVPDHVLNSPIGSSDGDIYNRFINQMFTAKKTFEKPDYWKDIRANVK